MVRIILCTFLIIVASPVYGEIIFSDSFESGDFSSPTGGTWGSDNSSTGCNTSVTSTIVHSGSYAMQNQWRGQAAQDVTSGQAERRFTFSTPVDEFYLRFYIYFPDGTEDGENAYVHRENTAAGENNKFFRIWQNDYNYGKWGGTLNWDGSTGSELTPRGNVAAGCTDNDNIPPYYNIYEIGSSYGNLGEWIAMEFHVKPDSGVGDGVYEVWVNGGQVVSITGIETTGAPCDPNTFQNGYIGGYANAPFPHLTNIYLDDVVFSDGYIGPLDSTPTMQGVSPSGCTMQ